MLYKSISLLSLILISFLLFNCGEKPSPQGKWLKGTEDEKIQKMEEHFRGFGFAMWEIGYRYQELYWAIKDENWGYADHHLHEIEETFLLALERRPERKKSTHHFLNIALPEMETLVKNKDLTKFEQTFTNLTNACNACHAMEQMPFITVKTPTQRISPVR